MKIVRFTSQAEAQAEADRLITALGLPNGMTYGNPSQIEDGTWVLKVKENGSWPSVNVIQGTIENYEPEDTL
tara:strand:+ start:12335 stop:12550 length:216 start_codon:yes stop_codon:yes gene_type:complete